MPEYLIQAAFALLIGGMIFFPSVVAPAVFKTFDADTGGAFLRVLFPRYYVFMIILSALGVVASLWAARPDYLPLAAFSATLIPTIWVLVWLVPRLNAWRDTYRAGDAEAGRKFNIGHATSVMINLAQLAFLIAAATIS